MSARGESPNADPVRLDSQLGSTRPNHPNRLMRIVEGRRMMVTRPKPILKDKGRNAGIVQEPRNLHTFVIHGQRTISAARTKDNRCPGVVVLAGDRVKRQAGLISVFRAHCTGRTIRVQQLCSYLRAAGQSNRSQNNRSNQSHSNALSSIVSSPLSASSVAI